MTDSAPPQKSVDSDAVRFFNESLAFAGRGDFQGSYQSLLAAVGADDQLAGAWLNLGTRLHEQKRWGASAAAFAKALSFNPEATIAQCNLAWSLHHCGRDTEALAIMQEVIKVNPETPQHWVNISQILLTLGQREEALKHAEEAVRLDPGGTMPRLALALAQLRLGDYGEGLKNYEARFPYIPVLKEFLNYPYPMWRGQDLSDKRLFVAAEQGLGDSIMFLRFLPEAVKRAKHTTILVHDSCYKLFKRNLPSDKVTVYPLPHELPAADYFCPMLSLPVGLNLTTDEITGSYWPYKVSYSPFSPKTAWKKIGICWAGDINHDNDRNRSAKLEDFLVLAELPETQLYSLQVGPRKEDLNTVGAHGLVKDMSGYFKTAGDTMAFIKHELDAVVTVDTAVAHMAGSVSVKTHMLLGKQAIDWRWGSGEGGTPWYPSLTMHLQKEPGNWTEVISRVKKEI